jgi:hypothetical protein
LNFVNNYFQLFFSGGIIVNAPVNYSPFLWPPALERVSAAGGKPFFGHYFTHRPAPDASEMFGPDGLTAGGADH